MTAGSSRTPGLVLGGIFLAFGVLEVVTHLDDTAVALAYWAVSLLGGGGLVIAGTLLLRSRRRTALALLTIGALVATNATVWTLVLPLFAVYVVVRAWRDTGATLLAG